MAENEEIIEIEMSNSNGRSDGSQALQQENAESAAPQSNDVYDQLLRTQADFINYKRRTEARLQEWRRQAGRDLIARLLPVLDDFDIFFMHHAEPQCADVIGGVRMMYNKMLSTLQEVGLTVVDPLGETFDPNVHEAVMTEENDQVEDGTIVRVWQKGYFHHDELLRPAKVITAKSKSHGDENVE